MLRECDDKSTHTFFGRQAFHICWNRRFAHALCALNNFLNDVYHIFVIFNAVLATEIPALRVTEPGDVPIVPAVSLI